MDSTALLVPGAPPSALRSSAPPAAAAPRAEPPAGFMREISKLSSFRLRRAARCSYSVLGERDSTESLARDTPAPALAKSQSSYAIERRQPPAGDASPREADEAERELAREPASVPDFADMVLPAPVPPAARLLWDSEEEEEPRRRALRKSASVRFTCDSAASTEDEELSTSDYASAERVGRVGFSNPHYLGPDVRGLGAAATPDSGVAPGDIELRELRRPRPAAAPARLHLLLVGGKEAAHPLLPRPLSLWTYRLL